jgi:hypothetical protein
VPTIAAQILFFLPLDLDVPKFREQAMQDFAICAQSVSMVETDRRPEPNLLAVQARPACASPTESYSTLCRITVRTGVPSTYPVSNVAVRTATNLTPAPVLLLPVHSPAVVPVRTLQSIYSQQQRENFVKTQLSDQVRAMLDSPYGKDNLQQCFKE